MNTKKVLSLFACGLILSAPIVSMVSYADEPTQQAVVTNASVEQKQENYVQQQGVNVLSEESIGNLNHVLNTFALSTDKETGEDAHTQFAIAMVGSLNGQSIEDYAMNLFNKQQIGDKKHNKGILLVVAVNDHKYRVQLGDGWEGSELNQKNLENYAFGGSLTDMLRSDNYDGAVMQIVQRTIGLASYGDKGVNVMSGITPFADAYNAQREKEKKEAEEYAKASAEFAKKAATVGKFAAGGLLAIGAIGAATKVGFNIAENNKREKLRNMLDVDYAFDDDVQYLNNNGYSNFDIVEDYLAKASLVDGTSLMRFIMNKANKIRTDKLIEEERQANKRKAYQIIETIKTDDLLVNNKYLAESFVETGMEANDLNMQTFVDNYRNNYTLLQGQKNASWYKPYAQAMYITQRTPDYRYTQDDIFERLIMWNLLTNSYRSREYYRSPEYLEHQRREQERAERSARQRSSSSSSSSSWSNWGGGGGFSSGGGASGSW